MTILTRSRRIDSRVVRKAGRLAAGLGAACLVASFALLVLIGSPGAVAAAATTVNSATSVSTAAPTAELALAAITTSCFPLTESGTSCYNAGEFCPSADLYKSGVAQNGTLIACEPDGTTQPHWEACAQVNFTASPGVASTLPACPVATAGSATSGTTSPTTAATTSGPTGAPATGGGLGPGPSVTLTAAGCAFIVVGAALILLSRRRGHRRPV